MGRSSSSQNCSLVTRQNDNHSPGPGRLVPSSHQRSELSNTILCTFSRGDKRISFPQPIKSNGCMHIHDRVRLMLSHVRVGKEWTVLLFLQILITTCSRLSGEKMGWPSFSASSKKQKLYVYSWQRPVDVFTCWGGKEWASPVFLHPDNHLQKVDIFYFSGCGKNGTAHFFIL